MENDIDKKLKEVMKDTKKKKLEVKVKVGVFAGRKGPYKLYKTGSGELVAVKCKKHVKGGATAKEINDVGYDEKVYNLPDLIHHQYDDAEEDETLANHRVVEAVELKTKKRIQSTKHKKWMDEVKELSKTPEMKGKSWSFVLQEASRKRKLSNAIEQ